MDELSPGPATTAAPERVGATLRAARERQGLSLAEVATRTRVPLRHLEAIEANDYNGLPSPTYATGFAKAYARAVGADEVEVARGVRAELAGVTRPKREYQPYEVTDPARVPSKGVAIVALGVALAVLVLGGLYFATGLFRGGSAGAAPQVVAVTPGSAVAVAPVPTPVPANGGQVLVTATDEVWVRIYEAGGGRALHQGVLQAGQRFDVPAEAVDPMINVGRPDKIQITVNGSQLQGLDLGADPIKDVRVSAAALRARAAGQPYTPPAAAAAPIAGAATTAPTTPSVPRSSAASAPTPERRADRPAAAPRPAGLSETQRANLDAANTAPVTPPLGNSQ